MLFSSVKSVPGNPGWVMTTRQHNQANLPSTDEATYNPPIIGTIVRHANGVAEMLEKGVL